MATFLHRALENMRWRLEAITPTDVSTVRGDFHRYDKTKLKPGRQSGMMRAFEVRWMGSGPDLDPTDGYERTAEHEVELDVVYPVTVGEDALRSTIIQDRHDIIACLRAENTTGYSADAPTAATGIVGDRLRKSDRLNDSDDEIWTLTSTWTLTVREVEE